MRICLVASDPFSSQVLREFLTDLGYKVQAIRSLYELPAMLDQEAGWADLVFLDPPAVDERYTYWLRQVRERYPELLMVLMADLFPFPPEELVSLGIHRYLRKPIHLEELEFALRGLCPECARCKCRREKEITPPA